MQDSYRAFIRDDDGSWTCIEAVTLARRAGRIQVAEGTRLHAGIAFMGIDLVHLLEAERARRESDYLGSALASLPEWENER
jgi:hypothetical protein